MSKLARKYTRRNRWSSDQAQATPERKERRRLVKILGRRQAIRHTKDMRAAAKLPTQEANHE